MYELDQSSDNSVLFDDVVVRYPLGIADIGVEGLANAIARETTRAAVEENARGIESVAESNTALRVSLNTIDLVLAPGQTPTDKTRGLANANATDSLRVEVRNTNGQLESVGDRLTGIETEIHHPATGLATKASVDELQSAQSTNEAARATLGASLEADYSSQFDAQQQQINARATNDRVDQVESDAESANASLSSSLQADYNAKFDTAGAARNDLQQDINTRATNTRVDTVESDAQAARSTLEQGLTAQYTAADSGLQSDYNAQFQAAGDARDAIQQDVNTRATIQQLQDAQADDVSARAQLSTTLQADYDGKLSGKAAIQYVDDVVADEAGARTSAIQTAQSQLDDQIGSVQQSLESEIDAVTGRVETMYAVRLDNDGYVGGFGLANDGQTVQAAFRADLFSIGAPGADSVPAFVVENGNVYQNSAIIKEASITSAMIETVAANKVVAESLSAISANLGDVTAGTFRTTPTSGMRFEASSEGAFPIWVGSGAKSAANALMWLDDDLHVRGDVIARGIQADAANIISTLMLRGEAVTFPLLIESLGGQNIYNDNWHSVMTMHTDASDIGPKGAFAQIHASVNVVNRLNAEASEMRVVVDIGTSSEKVMGVRSLPVLEFEPPTDDPSNFKIASGYMEGMFYSYVIQAHHTFTLQVRLDNNENGLYTVIRNHSNRRMALIAFKDRT